TEIVYEGDEAPFAVTSVANGDWHLWLMSMSGLGFSPSNPISCIVHGSLWFLPLYIVTLAAGGTAEAAFAIVRKHEINEGFLVTSMLYPLTLPPTCPLWIAALGILFGVVLAKEVFGGTGKNFLNIALTSRAFLYFAYPGEMIGDKVWNAGTAALRQPDGSFADGYSAATMLTWMGTADGGTTMAQAEAASGATFFAATLGNIEGAIGSTSALACLIGAGILIATGVGSWRIIAGCVVGMVAFATPLWLIGSETNAVFAIPPWTHLVIGGFAFGAVFMATDPVSASMTNTGRWVYGILIGLMTALIRVVNPAFPEGIGLAVLFGNVFAPLIDYFVVEANIARRKAYLTKGSAQTA
ncbi:MAG: NADH:ubiquinone reductase (Na(+)-transporting) subunit B, partial [Planctomycetota bacterium]